MSSTDDDMKGSPPELQKPKKASEVEKKDLKPKLSCMPDCMPDLRKKAFLWYPGPEFCAHRMHWTEWLFGIFMIIAIVFILLALLGTTLPSYVYGIAITINAPIALVFIWGFAKYKSLAALAERLERLAEENHTEVCAYTEINNEWDEGLKRGQDNLNAFTSSLGLVQDDAEALNDLTGALQSLVSQKKKIQAEEKSMFEIQKKHQRVTRAEIDEKERSTMKKQLVRMFDRIVRASMVDKAISTPADIDALRKKLQENKFLNQTIEGTDEPMFSWLPEFEKMAEDGRITKYELLDALDVASHSYFLEIKHSREQQSHLEEELESILKQPL